MFTQCPNCETSFQVTAEQLKAASGDVRCGHCLNVFNAINHLIDEASIIEVHRADIDAEDYETENSTNGISSTSIDEHLEEFFGDLFEDSPNETFDKPIKYATPEAIAKTTKPTSGFFYGANEATIEKILKEEDVKNKESNNEAEKPAGEPLSESRPETPHEELADDAVTSTDNEDKATGTTADSPENDELSNVPSVILDELEAAKQAQLKPPTTQWMMGSIILMLVFVSQAIYFSRDSLAKDPKYHQLLTRACNVIGCEINVAYDTSLIEILSRDVRSHPTSKNALIAGTTLINNAPYAQPYPLLTLTFSNITGTVLAQRRFTPREYLKSGTNIKAGMPSEVPVQVELQLVDPGKTAVNFEFRAEPDPRT